MEELKTKRVVVGSACGRYFVNHELLEKILITMRKVVLLRHGQSVFELDEKLKPLARYDLGKSSAAAHAQEALDRLIQRIGVS